MKRFLRRFLNWKFLITYGISWLVCHGWAFIFVVIGPRLDMNWMTAAGSFWVAIILTPNAIGALTPIPLATGLIFLLFPNDQKLKDEMLAIKEEKKKEKDARKEKRAQRKLEKNK